MVYPYLDSMLDDAGTAEAGKLVLVAKLKDWLEGCDRLADLDPGLVALMAVSSRAFALD